MGNDLMEEYDEAQKVQLRTGMHGIVACRGKRVTITVPYTPALYHRHSYCVLMLCELLLCVCSLQPLSVVMQLCLVNFVCVHCMLHGLTCICFRTPLLPSCNS
jgi:hypothetical protein